MGRPSFVIDPSRLRAIRLEQGLTQLALAAKVMQQIGRPMSVAQVRHYQRVEKDGRTSLRYAGALATVLRVSVPLLQGLEDPDEAAYLRYVKELIQGRLKTSGSSALHALLARHLPDDPEKAMEYLAHDIAEHIEHVLLVRNPTMMKELAELTGLSEAELLAPANAGGFWFLSANSRIATCSEVVNGVALLNRRVDDLMREFLVDHSGDSTVRMWHDSPWIRIEIYRPRTRDRMLIDFTRCQPGSNGLRWVDASWRDNFFLEPGIASSAYAIADVVTDFSGRTAPAEPERLRLVVDEHESNLGKAKRRMVVDGDLDQIPELLRSSVKSESMVRTLAMNWLTADLKRALTPHLAVQPLSAWEVHVQGVVVDISLRDVKGRGSIFAELRYRIRLAEETAPQVFNDVPVRKKDLDELRQKIEQWLTEGDLVPDDADQRKNFVTI